MKNQKANILIVDDQPDEPRALAVELRRHGFAKVVHPQAVVLHDLTAADLVLVDYRLENWDERDRSSGLSLRPINGIALAAVLRAHCEHPDQSPTGFAIHSAHLAELTGGLPSEHREHLIARGRNLEWAFPKVQTVDGVSLVDQVLALARAIKALPRSWRLDAAKTRRLAGRLLALTPRVPWSEQAWSDIESCHPPLHEISERSHGLAFIRWLLHWVLPYPAFLYDTHRLAARVRVSPVALCNQLEQSPRLKRIIAPYRYNGILAGFLGERWWKAGVETFLWKESRGNAFDPDTLRPLLRRLGLRSAGLKDPVVCLDEHYKPLQDLQEATAAIRIQPDDWPPYADQAWTTRELAMAIPALAALVVGQDKVKLEQ
jgi:hypothetical protein